MLVLIGITGEVKIFLLMALSGSRFESNSFLMRRRWFGIIILIQDFNEKTVALVYSNDIVDSLIYFINCPSLIFQMVIMFLVSDYIFKSFWSKGRTFIDLIYGTDIINSVFELENCIVESINFILKSIKLLLIFILSLLLLIFLRVKTETDFNRYCLIYNVLLIFFN